MRYLARLSLVLVAIGVATLGAASEPVSDSRGPVAPSTEKMYQRLEAIIQATDPMDNSFMNTARVKVYRQRITGVRNPTEFLTVQFQLIEELLRVGDVAAALSEMGKLEEFTKANGSLVSTKNKGLIRMLQAIAYLRQGEQDNCLLNHNADSCLFPVQGGGVHRDQRGSRAAIGVLMGHLDRSLGDLKAQWLLNVAHMTVGEYPDKVPAKWLIDPKYLASDYDLKRFPDIADKTGLSRYGLAGGAIAEDFDGDGFLDLMVSSWDLRGQLQFFHNNADGTFTERTKQAGLMGEIGGLNIMQTDFNNDGHPDVLILRGAWMGVAGHYPNSLLRNNGNGTFTDVTEEAGLLSFHPTQTAAWFDYNGDGWLDLFIGNESNPKDPHPNELYRNNGNGTFTECAKETGLDQTGFVKGVAAGDFNNDGRIDLYLSHRGNPNRLFRNDGPAGDGAAKGKWKFTDVSAKAGVSTQVDSFPTWFMDYDNDGWLDIVVTGYSLKNIGDIAADYLGLPNESEKARLYRNNRDGTFADVSKEARLFKLIHAMGSNFGDLDNDGWLDLYFGTGDPDFATLIPNRMFRNAEGKFFQEVTTSGGFGHLQKGHAVSFADFDNDGDQDIYEVMGGAYEADLAHSVLYENPGQGNHWLTLKVEGVKSNRPALGARIKVLVQTETGDRTIYKAVSTGGSFGSSPFRQEIGLGQAKAIRSVEIFWPTTGQTQRLTGLAMDRFYNVKEGDTQAVEFKLKTFKLGGAVAKHDHHAHGK
jgi:hypothetical protein